MPNKQRYEIAWHNYNGYTYYSHVYATSKEKARRTFRNKHKHGVIESIHPMSTGSTSLHPVRKKNKAEQTIDRFRNGEINISEAMAEANKW